MFLEGEHIYLRELRVEDVNENYYKWMNDPEVVKYLESGLFPNSMESLREFVTKAQGSKDIIFLAIMCNIGEVYPEFKGRRRDDNGTLIKDIHMGNIKMSINWVHRTGEIGIMIGRKDCWGKGYATEAIRLVADYAFTRLGLHKLTASAYAPNKGSICAFEKAGFVVEGSRPGQFWCNGEWVDCIQVGMQRPVVWKFDLPQKGCPEDNTYQCVVTPIPVVPVELKIEESTTSYGPTRNICSMETSWFGPFRTDASFKDEHWVTGKGIASPPTGILKPKPRIVAIIQARMGSTRLPGKVMADINGKPMLWYVVERVKQAKLIDEIVVATGGYVENKSITDYGLDQGWKMYNGSENDVLKRYYFTAKDYHADIIVRITADCPLIDPEVIDKAVSEFLNVQGCTVHINYISNVITRTYPDGLDVEVFTFEALEKAHRKAISLEDREHVTTYIRREDGFLRGDIFNDNEDLFRLRWTVDTQADLDFVREVYKYIWPTARMNVILELLKEHPEIEKINAREEKS